MSISIISQGSDSQQSNINLEVSFDTGISDWEEDRNMSISKRKKRNKKKKKKNREIISWEETRWDYYKQQAEIAKEAKETWILGSKLGLLK